MQDITIETLEMLAARAEQDDVIERVRLMRLIAAYARIASTSNPEEFRRRATRYADESGHWDNSYPPSQEYQDHSGPRSILIAESITRDVATTGGFYHRWQRVTEIGALAVGAAGLLYRSHEEGTGAVGQYAAHPGDHEVDITITWTHVDPADADAITIDEIRSCEITLRALAFPLIAARMAAQANTQQ